MQRKGRVQKGKGNGLCLERNGERVLLGKIWVKVVCTLFSFLKALTMAIISFCTVVIVWFVSIVHVLVAVIKQTELKEHL
jgi:hypothetical protein